ncbi:MAG TPA: polysaccharide deacetylase family protein [Verrucomicrobiae bacterium]|jgi:peptidoglycan/xylan/chitin deacetylase (PgdA/CDA1 family)|nr:polysaccharide deacetylase family protein [Verrucomicrobiae bacterium]
MKRFTKILWGVVVAATLFFGASFFLLPLPGHATVLLYHFIDTPQRSSEEKNVVSAESLERQMAFLKHFGFRVITLQEFYDMRMGKRKPRSREILLTFDDGDYSFDQKAMPILKKYGLPATIFVISENVKNASQGSMNQPTIQKLRESGLITVESHSKTHPLLSQTSPEQLKDEVEGSKRDLEAMFGVPMRFFAYPSGDLNEQVVEAVKAAGYDMAFATGPKRLKKTGVPRGQYSEIRMKITRTSDLLVVYWFKLSGLYNLFRGFRA